MYVDEVILVGTSLSEFDRIKDILHINFKIKDLGILNYLLDLKVAYLKEGIFIPQRKYSMYLLHDTCLLESKHATIPLNPSTKLHQDGSKPLKTPHHT